MSATMYKVGMQAALHAYNVPKEKVAFIPPSAPGQGWGSMFSPSNLWYGMTGDAGTGFKGLLEGMKTRSLHSPQMPNGKPGVFSNMLWPTISDPSKPNLSKGLSWGMRGLQYAPMAMEAHQALKGGGDPNQSKAQKIMSAVGGTAGMLYGGRLAGMLGAPLGSTLGRAAGNFIGKTYDPIPSGVRQQMQGQQDPMMQGGY